MKNNTSSELEFIGTKEVAALMGCSIPTARSIMQEKSFPLIKCGKNYRVMKKAFEAWASERRV